MRLPAFGLRGITVTGDVAYNNAVTVRANVAPRLSGNFFTLDLASAREVFETLPWVQHAVVQREFPNRLRVVLRTHPRSGRARRAIWSAASSRRFGQATCRRRIPMV